MGSRSTGEPGPAGGPGRSGTGELPPSTPRGLNDSYSPGKKIGGKYELVRPLGQGGMATVWVAHNEALDIQVAIKFIRTELKELAGLDSRLLQEARAAARLGHPAIVRVSDFGNTEAGDPYIVMELLSGEDLARALARRGPLEPLRAVRTLLPIADALAAAHERKIVHRDLKPENVFLAETPEGRTQPKLVDFGIAKLEREDGAGDKRITEAGRAMGSPAYMSPEQARGQDVDARTDIWSMCVMLYEVLTRKLPFDADSYPALVAAILEKEPKSILEHGVLEPALWDIIRRGLKKQADKRWADMRALGAALANWAIEQGADDDISGRSLMCTWIERPPDSLRAGTRTSVTAVTAITDLPDYDPESIRRPTPAVATSPSEPALLASGSQLAVSMESQRGVPTKWLVALAIAIPLLLIAVVLLITRPSGQGGATSATPAQPGPPTSGTPVVIPTGPPVPVPTQPRTPAVEPSSSAAQPPRSRDRTNPRASAQPPASSAPAVSTGALPPLPSGKKPSWDTDSPLPPQ